MFLGATDADESIWLEKQFEENEVWVVVRDMILWLFLQNFIIEVSLKRV
jgi:hypothetical protein